MFNGPIEIPYHCWNRSLLIPIVPPPLLCCPIALKKWIDPNHPVIAALNQIKQSNSNSNVNVRMTETDIDCSPLTVDDLQRLVEDALKTSPHSAGPITEYLHHKSRGNIFHARAVLNQMVRDRVLVYRINADKSDDNNEAPGEWKLQSPISLVSLQSPTPSSTDSESAVSDVVQLVQQVVKKLNSHTQQLLSLASCLGSTFRLDVLALVSQLNGSQVMAMLNEAVKEELLEIRSAMDFSESPISDAEELDNASEQDNEEDEEENQPMPSSSLSAPRVRLCSRSRATGVLCDDSSGKSSCHSFPNCPRIVQ